LRSTPLEVAPGEGPLPSYSDYSSSPFPQWPVPTWNCLPDGGRLVQKQGDTLKYWRILPTVKAVVADNCERDIETAHSLVTGLGLPDYDVRIEESLFNPFPSVCEYQLPSVAYGYQHSFLLLSGPQPSVDFYASALQARALSVLPPPNREQLMNDLQEHLGKGVAPPISEIAEGISNRQLTGARALASDFAESVLHCPLYPCFPTLLATHAALF
jgi:hypothetical protein